MLTVLQTGEVRIPQAARLHEVDSKETIANGSAAEPVDAGGQGSVSVHLIAAHAAWFDWERIADVERSSLPEFFDGRSSEKTPEVRRAPYLYAWRLCLQSRPLEAACAA